MRADFEDTDFEQIDMISILFIGGDGVKESMVDAFEVSGPRVLAVQPKEKLVISWGEIKNYSLLKRG